MKSRKSNWQRLFGHEMTCEYTIAFNVGDEGNWSDAQIELTDIIDYPDEGVEEMDRYFNGE